MLARFSRRILFIYCSDQILKNSSAYFWKAISMTVVSETNSSFVNPGESLNSISFRELDIASYPKSIEITQVCGHPSLSSIIFDISWISSGISLCSIFLHFHHRDTFTLKSSSLDLNSLYANSPQINVSLKSWLPVHSHEYYWVKSQNFCTI